MNNINWPELFIGTFLGSLFVPFGIWLANELVKYLKNQLPAKKLLGTFSENESVCKIFVRDLLTDENSKLVSVEPRVGVGVVPNIGVVWPEVEGFGVSYFLNVLGSAGKTKGIEIVKMSQDKGEWNANIVVMGAQAQKSFDFYQHMQNVAYSMDEHNIHNQKGEIVKREDGFGYGLILKARNPYNNNNFAFLIGGYGVLGTLAAAYYFRTNYQELGKLFGKKCFGVIVRCPITAGEEATTRLEHLDVKFNE